MSEQTDTAEPLAVRPAATVMLVRDVPVDRLAPPPAPGLPSSSTRPVGIEVFLMRRHAAMEFAAGMTVFPGCGVDDRDRDADLSRNNAWFGPEPAWWATRFGIEADLAEALVCAAARETFEESGVLFAGTADDPDGIVRDASVYRDQRAALEDRSLSFGDFLRAERLVLRADLLRPWSNWVTPKEERTRRYDTYFFVGALPQGQRADGENTESDHADWARPEAAIEDFAEGRALLLPPTWSQLDSLTGRTVSDVLSLERHIDKVQPTLTVLKDNWEIEFFDADRYNQARRRALGRIKDR
jgi:8-oxo-dGTP pyrophosphatase MutT (NUDIX family)